MKNKTKIKIMALAAVAAAAATLAGCKIGETSVASFLKDKKAENQAVTYYGNGGWFNNNTGITVKNLYYPVGETVITDFDKISKLSVSRTNYVFGGWYYAQLDADGKPVMSDDGKTALISENKVDIGVEMKIEAGQHLYFCAKWLEDVKISFELVSEDGGDITVAGNKIKNGEVVGARNFGTQNAINLTNRTSPADSSDYTFYDYYEDKACTRRFSGLVPKPDGNEDVKLYAKYIKGKWTMVRDSSEVQNMLNRIDREESFYLYPDDGKTEIDCSNLGVLSLFNGDCNAKIKGNGVTVSGVKYSQSSISQYSEYSAFGTLTEKAEISDITFKNMTVAAAVKGKNTKLFLICTRARAGAEINNVTFENLTFTITAGAENAPDNVAYDAGSGKYSSDNWLCGGEGSDEKFFAKFTGLTVVNAELLIGTRGQEAFAEAYGK